jgi:phage gp46-like protein
VISTAASVVAEVQQAVADQALPWVTASTAYSSVSILILMKIRKRTILAIKNSKIKISKNKSSMLSDISLNNLF